MWINLIELLINIILFIVVLPQVNVQGQGPFQTIATKRMIKEKNDSQKLARTLCIIFIVFVACWTPHIIMAVSFWS